MGWSSGDLESKLKILKDIVTRLSTHHYHSLTVGSEMHACIIKIVVYTENLTKF